ncbi:MAG: hypothetical protein WDM71_09735 [Ferruginibacter sp.]
MKYFKMLFVSAMFLIFKQVSFAQEKVNVNGHDVGTWFSRNWMWITIAIVVLLILLLSTNGGTKKTTTIVRDNDGTVKSVTTKEEID